MRKGKINSLPISDRYSSRRNLHGKRSRNREDGNPCFPLPIPCVSRQNDKAGNKKQNRTEDEQYSGNSLKMGSRDSSHKVKNVALPSP